MWTEIKIKTKIMIDVTFTVIDFSSGPVAPGQ